ncbi:3-isopropylmalate dehydratase large subunit [Mailhella sp.]|uniref:3-isopropylmalate dehydratase large subunit n=1 Tax=Mailhella sp. TaxID=1981029 RepID=UPI003AB66BF0
MGMTVTQKILAAHAGLKSVTAGQLIEAKLDVVMGNDITIALAVPEFRKAGADKVFDKDKVVVVLDHFAPNKDIKAAMQCKVCREFARENELTHFFDVGRMGIEHALLPEQGIVAPGEVIIGGDSHTCTYGALGAFSTGVGSTDLAMGMATGENWFKVPAAIRFHLTGKPGKWVCGKDVMLHIIGLIGVDGALYRSMEFSGDGVASLSMDDRFSMTNMAIEAGAKNATFPVDDVCRAYLKEHCRKPWTAYEADEDAEYEKTIDIDLSAIRPTVAFPHLPSNTRTIDEVGDVELDQVFIGSCTNGRMEDMAMAASILKGRKVSDRLRVIVIPATPSIYMECMGKGYIRTFMEAGCAVSTPTCGACLGGHMGILAAGEKCLSTTNRNFVGRMGHVESEVYLCSPAVAAASAIAGRIVSPETIMDKEGGD